MVTLENALIRVIINEYAATLHSVYDRRCGTELLWQGDEKSWPDRDIVIFPHIARLKDGWYEVEGKRYEMDIHGLAYYSVFEVIKNTADTAVLQLKSTAESKKKYPFDFVLRVTYTLTDNKLTTQYEVINTGDKPLPFGLGGHPAYALDCTETAGGTDTSGNYLSFENTPTTRVTMDESNHFVTGTATVDDGRLIELDKRVFSSDAVIYKDIQGSVTLIKRKGGKILFDLNNPPIFAFWSHATYGGYVCIEPWWGLPDGNPPVRELKDKALENVLMVGKTFSYSFTATYL